MNRELKFRAWDLEKKVMRSPKDGDFIAWPAPSNWKDFFHVMQFTGLKDKNGNDIYEGDILIREVTDYQHEDYQAFVDSGYETIEPMKKITDVCSLEHFRYWLKNESFGYEGEDLESPEYWTVIGNVYENPELLPSAVGV